MALLKSKVTVLGSKTRGWIITTSDNQGFCADIALTHDEAISLKELLIKKIN